jgi:hypothetical protein
LPLIFTNTSSKGHFQFEYPRIFWTRLRRISAANIGPNLFHQNQTVSWLMSIPRSCSKSSALRSESGNRTYIMTGRRMISGPLQKYLKGSVFVISKRYETALPA